ncbi:MAG: DEAD/DEAH box helicase, partial [Chloroflexi bacterium]|nr:DEAD/DEAH box helicase [Chloroflexota bacterium]
MEFENFFLRATGNPPYPYQSQLARCERLPELLIAATGTGKTEAAILAGWLWRRRHHPDEAVRNATPRRLVYCLPMRTLVEQTRKRVQCWLVALGLAESIGSTTLLGGEVADQWYFYPEQERIIIGTQDMLLSRALNRGYASSPFRWPWEFGLLNNDCFWVLDEVQLLANGLPTSTQLQGFRKSLGTYGTCSSLWMSATVRPAWLETVDFPAPAGRQVLTLGEEDAGYPALARRQHAPKTLRRLDIPVKGTSYDTRIAARGVMELHEPGSLTLVVVNTVSRAQILYEHLRQLKSRADLVLVHSRFRSLDRATQNDSVTAVVASNGPGRIVVATQAIEAGVDISARTLVTEVAPWASLVQRFGRCNRRGEYDDAVVCWIDLSQKDDKAAAPYDAEQLVVARRRLKELEGSSVAPADLPAFEDEASHGAVLRRRDLLDLFDTTADLSGSYVDVARFVRGSDERDVYVYWRTWEGQRPPETMPAPTREELCGVPIGELKAFLSRKGGQRNGAAAQSEADETAEELETGPGNHEPSPGANARRQVWHWSHLFRQWESAAAREICPGQTLLLRASDGGYTTDIGWSAESAAPVAESPATADAEPLEAVDDESSNTGQRQWVCLRDHSLHARDASSGILTELSELALPSEVQEAVSTAAHHHDVGKSHWVFQETMLSNL